MGKFLNLLWTVSYFLLFPLKSSALITHHVMPVEFLNPTPYVPKPEFFFNFSLQLSDSVLILEREKVELQRELTSLQQEIIDQQESKTNNTESTDNCQELMEAISQKNKHISQLLVDVEVRRRFIWSEKSLFVAYI